MDEHYSYKTSIHDVILCIELHSTGIRHLSSRGTFIPPCWLDRNVAEIPTTRTVKAPGCGESG